MRRINYKSDIPPLLLSLKVDENQITVPDCDFIVRFYIDGYEGRHYDCSHIGGVWSNCEPSEDGTKLVCYINNQRLGIGELCAEFHYISPDRRYSDGSQKSVVIIDSTELGVELVEDNGDAVTEATIDVTLPFIYRTAYEIARDHGYTGTAEDFYSALASVVGIADAEKKRVTAEITRNANEQERIENEESRLNAESERVNAEAQRVRNEAIRGDAEGDRVEQEEDRKAKFKEITEFISTVRANEGNRESNELERQTNEDTRITEEAKRVEAEKKRAAEFEQQKLDLAGKIDRSGDEMGGDLIFTDNAGVSFRTSDGGVHTMFNDTDDVAKFTADNGDTFEFAQDETPNKNSSAVVVSANLYNALDMTLDSMGSALDGDAAYRAEAGDKIFNPDTCKIQRYNSTVGGFEDLCDPIEGKLYANKMTDYIYRWNTEAKKMVFVGGVKAYTKEEADSRFAKLDDATQTVNVKELNANNFVSAKSMWIGDEGLLLGGDGNGHLTVEQDEVITDVTLNGKLATKADDVAYGVEWNNGQPTGEMQETTVKDATKNTTVATLFLAQSYNALEQEVEKKADKTELDSYATKEYVQTNAPNETKDSIEEKLGAWFEEDGGEPDAEVYTKTESDALFSGKVSKTDIVQSTGTSTTSVMSQKAVSDFEDAIRDQVNNYNPIVIEGNVTNAADEEDITSENGLLKLKGRSALNGMGYVILRKDKTFAEQVTQANTIYEIRYDFDLNGAEITIPENCVLKFNGGSFKNGTINGNLYNIDAQRYKIFENINIKGAAKLNNYYLIDWWVKTPQYEFIKENNSIDNYEDIQSAFNSGAENFIFSSDRYYYITRTLLINGEINLFSDVEHKHYDGNDRAHRKEPPCLYSNEVVTLIEYKYKSNTYKGTIYIGSINLVCNKPFSDLSEKDTPILYIHADQSTVNTTIWGVVIKCNIKAKDLVIDLKNEYPDIYEQSVNIYAPNYTGLMIKADYVNFSYIKICSYICMTYYGIIIPNTENNHWITDVTIEGDTRCVIGGKFIGGGNPVRIFGSHQPVYALAKTDEVRRIGYFSGEYIQLYGYIWDINQDALPEKGNCTAYPIQINSVDGDYNNPILNNTILSPAIRFIKNADLNFRNFSIKALFLDNVLNYIGSPLFTNKIRNFSLKLNNVDYTEYPQIYNTRYLFGVYPWIIGVGGLYKSLINRAYILTQSDEEIPYKLHFELNSIGYTDEKELIIKHEEAHVYINIQTKEGKVLVNDTYNLSSSFYANSYFSIVLPGNIDFIVDIETKIKKPKGTYAFLPLIKIPNDKSVFCNKANISDIKGDFIYDTTSNKAGWWNGEYWADINGYSIDYNVKGTTANRPTLKNTDDGFEYYDTTLKKKIIWNGTEWTNMDGTNLI